MEQRPSSEASSYSASQETSFYGTQSFITIFTKAHHLAVS